MITLELPEGECEALLVGGDDDSAPRPGVLLCMDALGLRPQIESMATEIAGWGYVVLAPNLCFRSGSVKELAPTEDLRDAGAHARSLAGIGPRLEQLTAEVMYADAAAYLQALAEMPQVAGPPFGLVGYCMGARFALRAAGAYPDLVAACAGFHGGGLATEDPDSPHLSLAGGSATQFLFGHADNDASNDETAIERLGFGLRAAGVTATSEVYRQAEHGFTMADTAVYDETAAKRAMTELRDLFARTLGQSA